jgi:hypothetical protein
MTGIDIKGVVNHNTVRQSSERQANVATCEWSLLTDTPTVTLTFLFDLPASMCLKRSKDIGCD